MEKIEIVNSKGYKVKAQIELPTNKQNIDKIVIACHGFGSDKDSSIILELSEKLSKNDIGVISFDFTGHGESDISTEEISMTNCIEDVRAIKEYIEQNYKNAKIGIFGSSFGAAVSLSYLFITNQTVDALILRCPAIEMGEILKNVLVKEDIETIKGKGYTYAGFNEMKILYSFYEDTMKYNLYDMYKNKPMKILIMHGDADDTAPVEDTIKFANIHPELVQLEIFKGTDHRFKKPGELDRAIEISLKYLNKCFE